MSLTNDPRDEDGQARPSNGGTPSLSGRALPQAQRSSPTDLLQFRVKEDGRVSITIPAGLDMGPFVDSCNERTAALGLPPAILPGDIPSFLALGDKDGVAVSAGMTYEIKPDAGRPLLSHTDQSGAILATGEKPAPLYAIALGEMCLRIETRGAQSLLTGRLVRSAASGLVLWSRGGSICVQSQANNPDPSTTMASARVSCAVA